MASVPITIVCMVYPRDKSISPYPATIQGYANVTGLEVGGGPIIPPEGLPEVPKPEPPLTIWGGPFDPPHPAHPIVLPPDLPPEQPPAKPEPPHEGWNWSAAKSGWYFLYVPREGTATPKK